ncbi:metallophosphoesterase [Paenibacillus cremeus]|uniref:Metallophosphoesterase n=1 Tax=Paenibacillus cremeus TaxID=2163881 RepID=A0A559JMI9_9BACL|nr:metallophosphoesterase [Paenibacillus cremeus]TVY01092.1 metallophosphoesterase [Paenibacillus cremeus]
MLTTAIALLSLLAVLGILYLALILPTQWLKVERVEVGTKLGKKALQFSDLHVERLRITPKQLQKLISLEQPDYIFITGDFTKLPDSLPKLITYLKLFQDSGIPTYAVLGNHDHQQPKVRNLIRLIESYNIRVLRNESVQLEGFQLVGIDDFNSGKSNITKSFSAVVSELPVIIITHDPNIVLFLTRPYSFLMAGHLHGRQFNVPFFYKFRRMGKLPAMGIYKGVHTTPFGKYYISKGLGQTAFNVRFMVRSEVTVHQL